MKISKKKTLETAWGTHHFCWYTQQFSKISKMSLWVFSVINNILFFHFYNAFFFVKSHSHSVTCFCLCSFVSVYCRRECTCVVYGYTVKFGGFSSSKKKKCVFFFQNIWIDNPYDWYGLTIRIVHMDCLRIENPYVLNFFKIIIYLELFYTFNLFTKFDN